ncbi:hypothetical protein M3181_21420 [Mesobacillus maritimus]|uniref:DnaA N-terminal domain-containing protein n=1 Tax=Mesobacillus maritimus TaxID=1643336 RepID=UPI002040411C|nr:hypothetical protein [Mesobacillus maritimus]
MRNSAKQNRRRTKTLKKTPSPSVLRTTNEKQFLKLVDEIGTRRALQLISNDSSLTEENNQNERINELEKRVKEIEGVLQEMRNENRSKKAFQPPQSLRRGLEVFHFWNQVLSEIQTVVSKPSYDTWIKGTLAKIVDEDTIVVLSKNEFQSDWLEGRYKDTIFHAVKSVAGRTFELEFAVNEGEYFEG